MDKLRKEIKMAMDLLLFISLAALLTLIIVILMMIKETQEKPVEASVKEEQQIVMGRVIEAREESPMEVIEWEIDVTLEELELMSRVVMSEASTVPYKGKVSVAKVLINRVKDGRWGSTMKEVISYPNAFSTADNGDITDECREAVLQALEGAAAFPEDMLYFRSGHYHDFGFPYMEIGNLYFTTLNDYEALVNEQ